MLSYPRWISKFELKPNSWVFVPSEDSITEGRKIKAIIESIWSPPSYYYHLKAGGHVAAMKSHCANRYFIHLDIKNFFGSINKSRITRSLKKALGYEEARRIAIESTVQHPNAPPVKYMLPFGFVQSPIIASLCLRKSNLGKLLHKLFFSKIATVSVYMDDIIISMNDEALAAQVLQEVKDEALKSRFFLNSDKEEGPAVQITAFNIDLSHENIEIEPIRFDKFLTNYSTSIIDNQRKGIERYIKTVNPNQAKLLP